MPARYTIADLCRDLAEKTVREETPWRLTAVGRLRTARGGCWCPLQFVTGHFDSLGYLDAAEERGMTEADVNRVLDAADFATTKHPEVRTQLLAAAGLA